MKRDLNYPSKLAKVKRQDSPTGVTKRRLFFEPLEERRLLAGLDVPGLSGSLVDAPHNDSPVSGVLLDYVRSTSSSGAFAVPSSVAEPTLPDSSSDLLTIDVHGRIGVRVTGANIEALLPALVELSFESTAALPELHLVEGFVPADALLNLQDLAGVSGVLPIYQPIRATGSVTSQADVVLESDRVRGTLPMQYDGSGVTIGVLSDSYNYKGGAAGDIATDDLPSGGVNVLQDYLQSGASDEGRAMLQLVHDIAPGAELAFATAFNGEASFAQNIRNLADPLLGAADVIVDDVGYLTEPFFQDGPVAQAVNDVVLDQGVNYFAAAGNQETRAYESSVVAFAGDSAGLLDGSWYDFDHGSGIDTRQSLSIGSGQSIVLSFQWDDPFYTVGGVETDLDIFLVEAGTDSIVAGAVDANISTDTPFEIFDFTNNSGTTAFELMIERYAGPDPGRLKYVNYGSDIGVNEYDTNSPTVLPHAAAAQAMGVAAVYYANQTVPESFTSRGPATILFEPDGTPLTSPEVRPAPRIASIDGTDTTFFGSDADSNGLPNFFGTSAAAPHAAAVAALVRQANPAFTPAEINQRLEETALDISATGFDNITGAGLINAYDAVHGPAIAMPLNVFDGFEAMVLSEAWETHSTGPGRILVTADNDPDAGGQHLTLDAFYSYISGRSEAILHINATGGSNIHLAFAQKEFGDEDNEMSETFVGSENSDGVALSVDGTTWHRLISLTGSTSTSSYQTHYFDLSQIAADLGITLGEDVQIKFQQYDNQPIDSDGFAFDSIVVSDTAPASPGVWQSEGPAPAQGGQVEGIADKEVVGALHTVVAHPTDADILYAGGTNGGIWKTVDATASRPHWEPLADDLPSLSIGALTFDPTDATYQTLVAGTGRYSSFYRAGGSRVGLYKTVDGGGIWTVIDGGGTMVGRNVSGVVARGDTLVVSVNVADNYTYSNVGIFRSTDGGATFTQISVENGSATGLPGGVSYDLVADPMDPNVLYTSTVFSDGVGGTNGIYKSIDLGATWTRVSNATIDALISNITSNVEIAVGTSNNVYAAIINQGRAEGFFRSGNGGATWVEMDIPQTNEDGTDVGLNPSGGKGPGEGATPEEIAGGQGSIHFSIVADPSDPFIVYAGGDRQPRSFGDTGSFPNSIGAMDYSGRLFRGDASQTSGSQWVHLTHSNLLGAAGGGTASNSAPHADSREMVLDANGDIIEVDDGGIYRRTDPKSDMGDWFSINGDIAVTESHDVAYDPVADVILTGNQDTGTTEQSAASSDVWRSVSTADGGDVLVDSQSLAASNRTVRYSSYQNLGGFRRRVVDSNNNVVSTVYPALSVISGSAFDPQFDTPVALNAVMPERLLFGGDNGLYESLNQGNSIAQIADNVVTPGATSNPIAYGGVSGGIANPDVVYAGDRFGNVHVRTTSGGLFTSTDPDAASGQEIRDVRMDPDQWQTAFAIDQYQVFATQDAGAVWSDITGNLLVAGASVLQSLEYINGVVDAVVVGTNLGVFASLTTSFGSWFQLGSELPNVPVWDMDYEPLSDLLVLGTLGRGAWSMPDVSLKLATPPQVTRLAVSGNNWTPDFETLLNANGQSDGRYAVPVGDGSRQLASLPWSNVDRIHITFSEDVDVAVENLLVTGSVFGEYPVSPNLFFYDAATFTATWELQTPLFHVDKITITLDATNVSSVTSGLALDGDWDNPTERLDPASDVYPSGDGVAGGDFAFRIHTLPGDANGDGRVNISDLSILSANWFKTGMLQNQADFTGDTRVNISDLSVLSANWFEDLNAIAGLGGGGELGGPESEGSGQSALSSFLLFGNTGGALTVAAGTRAVESVSSIHVAAPRSAGPANWYGIQTALPAKSARSSQPDSFGLGAGNYQTLPATDVIGIAASTADLPTESLSDLGWTTILSRPVATDIDRGAGKADTMPSERRHLATRRVADLHRVPSAIPVGDEATNTIRFDRQRHGSLEKAKLRREQLVDLIMQDFADESMSLC